MRILDDAQARAALLPPTARGTFVVFFVGREPIDDVALDDMNALIEAAPVRLNAAMVEAECSVVADWFRIDQFPAMAVVFDGMLFAVEFECTRTNCEQLIRVAASQLEQFRAWEG